MSENQNRSNIQKQDQSLVNLENNTTKEVEKSYIKEDIVDKDKVEKKSISKNLIDDTKSVEKNSLSKKDKSNLDIIEKNLPDAIHSHSTEKHKEIYLKDYKPADFIINTINLVVDIYEDITEVTSTLKISRNPDSQNQSANLILSGEDLSFKSASINGNIINNNKYNISKESLEIFSSELSSEFELQIINTIKPHENTALSGLYKSADMFCTQCEAEGFRRITYFIDRPDAMSSFTTTIKADKTKYPVLLANGNLIEKGSIDNDRHFATWQDPYKKPCYLFAMVAGNLIGVFDNYITTSGRAVSIQLYTEHKNLDKTGHAIQALKKSMQWDETAYGREYDLDNYIIVAVDSFNMGAMENKGLNIFNSKYVLANSATATDDDYAAIDAVVGHEYFHNWSGNRVTLRDWFQLSLKEGFTVFREQQFVNSLVGSDSTRIADAKLVRSRQFSEDSGPMAHPVQPKSYLEINNFYTVTIYEKGAEIIRMMHTILGASTFRKGTDLYFSKYDGRAVTIEELITSMEEVSNRDLSQFRLWYSQAGTPEITVTDNYNSANKSYTITLGQYCPKTPDFTDKKLPMHIPVAIGLIDSSGNDMPINLAEDNNESADVSSNENTITTKILSLTKEKETYTFNNVKEKPVLSILRNFSAPVKIKQNVSNNELAFKIANDSDNFNRWDASQKLIKNYIKNAANDFKNRKLLKLDKVLATSFRNVLSDSNLDSTIKSYIMHGVNIDILIDELTNLDIDSIAAAKSFMLFELAQENKHKLLDIYYNNKKFGKYGFNYKDMSNRKLKNTSLWYLAKTKDSNIINICLNQFEKSDNMTDVLSALECLIDIGGKESEKAVADFYNKWHDDSLVVNKWLSVQARSDSKNTLQNVKKLMQHKAFSIKNPNNVYSLVGGFCIGNPVQFHEQSGSGYHYLADVIIELNNINPQVAARMITPLTEWHKFDKNRQNKMRAELTRIKDSGNLSKDVLEVVSKSLSYSR